MQKDSVFAFTDYRAYLHSRFAQRKPGQKTRAAQALGVHTSLLPQILKGRCELTLEQAENFNKFFGHEDDEAAFFLLLVLKGRAGNPTLRARFQTQIAEQQRKRAQISERVAKEKTISEKDQELFYSSYVYSAIHVLASIPALSGPEEIARALGLPELEVRRAVKFLVTIGLLEQSQGRLRPGSRHVHLPPDSPLIVNHHLNWRLKALDRIRIRPREDLHYSGALSLSEVDVQKIKEVLVGALARSTDLAVKSREETAYVLCLDFFRLLQK